MGRFFVEGDVSRVILITWRINGLSLDVLCHCILWPRVLLCRIALYNLEKLYCLMWQEDMAKYIAKEMLDAVPKSPQPNCWEMSAFGRPRGTEYCETAS
jgi:hypothetical protein